MDTKTRRHTARALRAAAAALTAGSSVNAAMKGVSDLVKQDGFVLRRENGPNTTFNLYLRGRGVGRITIHYDNSCQAYVVKESEARRGWGPFLYDLAIEEAGTEGLMPDRDDVSQLADNVWWKYKHNRPDVEDRPRRGTYCRDHWGADDAHLNRRYTKRGKPLTKELEKLGLIGKKLAKTKDGRLKLAAADL